MDLLLIRLDMNKLDCGLQLDSELRCRMFLGKGLRTFGYYMLYRVNNRSLKRILVDMMVVRLGIQANTSKPIGH